MAEWLTYFLVYLSSTVKFIFGPVLGEVYGFSVFVTGTLSILGMMTTVYLFHLLRCVHTEQLQAVFLPKKETQGLH